MDFGIYVHTQGPSPFREVATVLSRSLESVLRQAPIEGIDGLFLSYYSTSRFETGLKKHKYRVRRDYKLKLITGGAVHYDCMVELEVDVANAELIDASSTELSPFKFVQSATVESLRWALSGFSPNELERLQVEVRRASLPYTPRW